MFRNIKNIFHKDPSKKQRVSVKKLRKTTLKSIKHMCNRRIKIGEQVCYWKEYYVSVSSMRPSENWIFMVKDNVYFNSINIKNQYFHENGVFELKIDENLLRFLVKNNIKDFLTVKDGLLFLREEKLKRILTEKKNDV